MSDFEIAVEQLGPEAQHHTFEGNAAWWQTRDVEMQDAYLRVERPFSFEMDLSTAGSDLLVAGKFTGEVELECSRCAKRYSQMLRDDFRLVLSPLPNAGRERSGGGARTVSGPQGLDLETLDPEEARGLAENGICLGEELEAGWFKGPLIRFGDFFGELVALAIPLQPLCDSECPGVCSHCGAVRSEVQCDCEDEKVESPFAVLAKLKGDQAR